MQLSIEEVNKAVYIADCYSKRITHAWHQKSRCKNKLYKRQKPE